MPADFFDTNVLAYLALEEAKSDRASALITRGGTISVQVLNEFANVARRKRQRSWTEVREFLAVLRNLLTVVPVTVEMHEAGLLVAERYRLSIYDAMIVAAALDASCETLWSEDMHDGLVVDGRLTIRNPFVGI